MARSTEIQLSAENMIATMLGSSQNWNAVREMIRNIMRQKETDITVTTSAIEGAQE